MFIRWTFVFIIALNCHFSFAQWSQTNGPTGASVVGIHELNGYLFIDADAAGLYRSSNNGETWEFVSVSPFSYYLFEVEIEGNRIFCAMQFGIYYSDDYGQSWTSLNPPLTNGSKILVNGSEVYVQDGYFTLYYTPDLGETWQVLPTPSENSFYNMEKYDGTLWFASDGLFLSNDNALSWQVHPLTVDYSVGQVMKDGEYMYVNAYHRFNFTSHILISSDGGINWSESPYSFPGQITSISIDNGFVTLYSIPNSLLTSIDHGQTWNSKYVPELPIKDVFRKDQTIYVGSTNGIFKSTDNGDSWVIKNQGLIGRVINKIVAKDQYIIAVSDRQGVSFSSDLGFSWEYRNNGIEDLDFIDFNDIAIGSEAIFIGTSNGVYKTVDDGFTWTRLLTTPPNHSISHVGWSEGKVISVSYFGTYFSTDNGDTWELKASSELVNDNYTACFIKDDLVVLAAETSLKVSTNFGDDWSINPIPATINEIELLNNKLVVASYLGIFETSNLGMSWSKVNQDHHFQASRNIEKYGDKLYTSTEKGVFVSLNNGANWYSVNQGLETNLINPLLFHSDNAFVGTYGRGVWRSTIESLSIPPVVHGLIGPVNLNKNQSYELTIEDLSITDVDSSPDQLTVEIQSGDHYSVVGNLITPEDNFVGKLFVQVSVKDGYSNSPFVNITLSVEDEGNVDEEVIDVITSINDVSNTINVYPNPFTDYISIKASEKKVIEIKMNNTLGEYVNINWELVDDEIRIETQSLTPGLYFIHHIEKGKRTTIKALKINIR